MKPSELRRQQLPQLAGIPHLQGLLADKPNHITMMCSHSTGSILIYILYLLLSILFNNSSVCISLRYLITYYSYISARITNYSAMLVLEAASYGDSTATAINNMSIASIFGKENIEIVAILGGVIGFWGGVFVVGLIYLIIVCIVRLRKHSTNEGSGSVIVGGMMGSYSANSGFDARPPTRSDLIPRERKAKKACHNASFYKGGFGGGGRRSDRDFGLGRIGRLP